MILYSKWLDLPINTRHEIARIFGIPKKNPTHVQDNIIVSDGYDVRDVEKALSIANLKDYLGRDDVHSFDMLFDTMVYNIETVQLGVPSKVQMVPIETNKVELEVKAKKSNVKKTTAKK